MKNKVVFSTIAQLASQIIVAGLAVVILKLLTSHLGTHQYGIYAIVITFITAFSLLTDMGLNAITGREIAKHPDQAQNIISDNMTLRLVLSLVGVPVITGLGFLIYPHASQELRLGILLFSFDLVINAVRSVSLAYYSAKVKSHVLAAVTTINQALFLVFIILAVALDYGIIGIIWAFLLSDLIAATISYMLVRRHIAVRLRFRFQTWLLIAKMSLPLGIIQLVNMFYLKADSLLLSVLRSPTEVACYGVAYSLISGFAAFPGFLMTPLIPAMATADTKDLQRIIEKAFDVMAVFALFMAAIGFLLQHQFVLAVSGAPFLPAAAPFAILAFSLIFTYLNYVFGVACVAVNKYQKIIRVSIGSAILNIALNLVLVPHFGIKGAAAATAVTELIAAFLTYRIFSSQTGIRVNFLTRVWKPAMAALALIPISYLISPILHTQYYLVDVIVGGFVLGSCYVGLLYFTNGLPTEIASFLQKLFSVTRKPSRG